MMVQWPCMEDQWLNPRIGNSNMNNTASYHDIARLEVMLADPKNQGRIRVEVLDWGMTVGGLPEQGWLVKEFNYYVLRTLGKYGPPQFWAYVTADGRINGSLGARWRIKEDPV